MQRVAPHGRDEALAPARVRPTEGGEREVGVERGPFGEGEVQGGAERGQLEVPGGRRATVGAVESRQHGEQLVGLRRGRGHVEQRPGVPGLEQQPREVDGLAVAGVGDGGREGVPVLPVAGDPHPPHRSGRMVGHQGERAGEVKGGWVARDVVVEGVDGRRPPGSNAAPRGEQGGDGHAVGLEGLAHPRPVGPVEPRLGGDLQRAVRRGPDPRAEAHHRLARLDQGAADPAAPPPGAAEHVVAHHRESVGARVLDRKVLAVDVLAQESAVGRRGGERRQILVLPDALRPPVRRGRREVEAEQGPVAEPRQRAGAAQRLVEAPRGGEHADAVELEVAAAGVAHGNVALSQCFDQGQRAIRLAERKRVLGEELLEGARPLQRFVERGRGQDLFLAGEDPGAVEAEGP